MAAAVGASEMEVRIRKEGLQEPQALQPQEVSLQLLKWLGDAESNSNDRGSKLHQEVESYVNHLRELWEEKAFRLEGEKAESRRRLEALESGVATLRAVLGQAGCPLPDGHKMASSHEALDAITEHVATLLARNNFSSSGQVVDAGAKADLVDQLVQACTERELLRKENSRVKSQLQATSERLELLEKASQQLEMDNEKLALKLSEVLRKLEDPGGKEQQQHLQQPFLSRGTSARSSSRHKQQLQKEVQELQGQLARLGQRLQDSVAKHEQFKTKAKVLLVAFRKEREDETRSLQARLENLKREAVLQEKSLQTEKSLLERLQEDHRRLQEDRRLLQQRVADTEDESDTRHRRIQELEWRLQNTFLCTRHDTFRPAGEAPAGGQDSR